MSLLEKTMVIPRNYGLLSEISPEKENSTAVAFLLDDDSEPYTGPSPRCRGI